MKPSDALDPRSAAQLREHYEIEKALAARLRHATKLERQTLYRTLYDQLFQRIPHHPQLSRRSSAEETRQAVAAQMKFLAPYLRPDTTFLEVGPGDCALALAVAQRVRRVYAVDVSSEITKGIDAASNFTLVLSDGSSIPVPAASVDVVYSNGLMEHLHPDDAVEQLRNIYAALVPGGVYICSTPHRFTGPHDISGHFDDVATGLHLKEYAVRDLEPLFRKAGFAHVSLLLGGRGIYWGFPTLPSAMLELALPLLGRRAAKSLAQRLPLRLLFALRMVGVKPGGTRRTSMRYTVRDDR